MFVRVTYLGKKGSTYTHICGVGVYTFIGGKSSTVPAPVALRIEGKLDNKGGKMFNVSGLPKIITPQSKKYGSQLNCFN